MAAITTILADDDYLVLQDLETLVDWEALGFHIAGTAPNGKAALALVRKHRPALVITDISMPVMDGFDFVETVRKDFPDTYVMLISSYADFDYAKRAISDGIQDYILKNEITPAMMEKKLLAVKERIESGHKERRQSLHRQLGKYLEDGKELPRSIPAGRNYLFTVFCRHLPLERLKDHFSHLDQYGETLCAEAEPLVRDRFPEALLFTSGPFVIIAVPVAEIPEGTSVTALSLIFERIKALLTPVRQDITGYFCSSERSFPELQKLFAKARPVLLYYSTFPAGAPRKLDDLADKTFVPYGKLFPYDTLSSFPSGTDTFLQALDAFLQGLAEHTDADGTFMLYHNLMLQMDDLSGHLLPVPETLYADDPRELLSHFRSCVEECRELSGSGGIENQTPAVRLAQEYIKDHYSDPALSINQIAEAALLSPSRLSVLFKKETGQTVNDYLINARISRAVYLLENTNLRIYEVAAQAGYRSAQYFSQSLLQKTGRKPLDFRKKKP